MNADPRDMRLIEVINQEVPALLDGLEPQVLEPTTIKRGDGFPNPNEIWQSTDGQTVPSDWSQIEGYGFRIQASGGIQSFGTTGWPIVRVWASSRADNLAVTILEPYKHPGQPLSRSLVRYPRIDNVASLLLAGGDEVQVALQPQYIEAVSADAESQ